MLPDNPAGVVRYHRASFDYKPANIDMQQDVSCLDQGETGNDLAANLDDSRYESPYNGKNI